VADFDVCGEDSGESRSRLVLLMLRQSKTASEQWEGVRGNGLEIGSGRVLPALQ
jgi:hypothetical protein